MQDFVLLVVVRCESHVLLSRSKQHGSDNRDKLEKFCHVIDNNTHLFKVSLHLYNLNRHPQAPNIVQLHVLLKPLLHHPPLLHSTAYMRVSIFTSQVS